MRKTTGPSEQQGKTRAKANKQQQKTNWISPSAQTRLQPFLPQHPDPPFSYSYVDPCERTQLDRECSQFNFFSRNY